MRDQERRDDECGRDDEPCGDPRCSRCLPVCNTCGGDHLTADHVRETTSLRDTVDGINEAAWDRAMGGGPSTYDDTRIIRGTVAEWRKAGAL